MKRSSISVAWRAVLVLGSLIAAACGTKKGPTCAEVGRSVGSLEIAEEHGHLAQFMTEHEREEVYARWRDKCVSDRIDAPTRRCMMRASRVADALTCPSSLGTNGAGSQRVGDPVSIAWLEPLYGDRKLQVSDLVVAVDGSVVVSGILDGRGKLRNTAIDSRDEEAVWTANFDRRGVPRWIRALAGRRPLPLPPVAVTSEGTVIVGTTTYKDVDYGHGTHYLEGARDAGAADPMVLVTIPRDGSAVRALALHLEGGADDVISLDDGTIALATHAGDVPGREDECEHSGFVVARLAENATLEWARCADKETSLRNVARAPAHVAESPQGWIAVCASFDGVVRWGGHSSEPQPDVVTSAFVATFDPAGQQRWVRYVHEAACIDLAVAPDGTVAARFDEHPSPRTVRFEDARSTDGPAIAAWGSDGALRWVHTCPELLDMPDCTFASIVTSATGFAIVAGTDAEAVIAEIDAATGDAGRKRAARDSSFPAR